jgi:carbon storage regulator CsrA
VLVLSRHPDQGIVLPSLGVTVRVLSIKANVVRLGVEAPNDVVIVREELLPQAPAATPERPTEALHLCPS